MDAAMHGNHFKAGHHQDPDETTPSDASERPSVDDVESDTGSTGALETRSLKDHKGKVRGRGFFYFIFLFFILKTPSILFLICLKTGFIFINLLIWLFYNFVKSAKTYFVVQLTGWANSAL